MADNPVYDVLAVGALSDDFNMVEGQGKIAAILGLSPDVAMQLINADQPLKEQLDKAEADALVQKLEDIGYGAKAVEVERKSGGLSLSLEPITKEEPEIEGKVLLDDPDEIGVTTHGRTEQVQPGS